MQQRTFKPCYLVGVACTKWRKFLKQKMSSLKGSSSIPGPAGISDNLSNEKFDTFPCFLSSCFCFVLFGIPGFVSHFLTGSCCEWTSVLNIPTSRLHQIPLATQHHLHRIIWNQGYNSTTMSDTAMPMSPSSGFVALKKVFGENRNMGKWLEMKPLVLIMAKPRLLLLLTWFAAYMQIATLVVSL